MHRRTTMTLGTLAPWWLLFVVLVLGIAVSQESSELTVGIVSDGASHAPASPAPAAR